MRAFVMCLLAFSISIASGCGGGPGDVPELGNVSGTITMDGQPLPNALVKFHPTDGGRDSTGQTDSEGKYTLTYSTTEMGAKIGQHSVSIESGPASDDNLDLNAKTVPAKFNTATELNESVVSGDNEINFNLDSK